jgi:hypothetical protein
VNALVVVVVVVVVVMSTVVQQETASALELHFDIRADNPPHTFVQ